MLGIDEHLYWKDKCLIFTWHIKSEKLNLCHYGVLKRLKKGIHIKVSKNENKFNTFLSTKKGFLCLSYIKEEDQLILIHIKSRRKKWKDS